MCQDKDYGSWRVERTPYFDYAEPFNDGIAFVEKGYKQSFINKEGKTVIRHSSKRDLDSHCRCGRILFTTLNGNGFLNKKGKVIISPKHFNAEGFFNARCIVSNDDQLYGVINLDGEYVIEPSFDFIASYSCGLAFFVEKSGNGFMDINGKVIIKPELEMANPFSEGMAKVLRKGRKHFSIIDVYDNEQFSARRFQSIAPFSEKVAAVMIKGLYGFVDVSGDVVIQPKYKKVLDFSEGMAAVQYADKGFATRWGFIDARGKELVGPAFSEVRRFSEGLAAVRRMNEWGFVDKSGKFIVEPQFVEVSDVVEGYAAVTYYNGTRFIKFM